MMKSLPPQARRSFWNWCLRIGILLLVLVALAGALVWEKLFHEYPQQLPTGDPLAELKYGSIGVEESNGIPYRIWQVLPQIFPDHLPGPGGYASLGMIWEPGQEMPVGFSKRRIGYERVGINCGTCHTGSYRLPLEDGRSTTTHVVAGAPANRFDIQKYLWFLSTCADDARFNADTILNAIAYNHKMTAIDKALYRYVLIPGTRKALQKQAREAAWQIERPAWGAGRIDPFNPVKFGMLEMDPSADETVGNSDMMPLWLMNQRAARQKFHLHWDGLSTDLLDCSLAGALGDGATVKSLPIAKIERMVEAVRTLAPPRWPMPVDSAKVQEGGQLFRQHCARCHALDGELVNKPVDLRADGSGQHATDTNRLAMWNAADSHGHMPFEIYNRFGDGYAWDLDSFVATDAYVSVPLQGLWLRGPFLHNGSVPTIGDLLQPPATPAQAQEWIDAEQPGMFARLNASLASWRANQSMISDEDWARVLSLVPAVVHRAREAKVRPPLFLRGGDLLDQNRLGFVCDGSDRSSYVRPFVVATFIQGNSNAGHLYGTDWTDQQKQALIEYLKVESEQGEPHGR